MRKKMAQRRPWFLWVGGACFLVGSLVAGSVGLVSSAAPGPTVQGTVTANQGTAGSSSWPVSASQSGTWQQEITDGTNVLGTSDHPVRTDPTGTTTQPVSGLVGITDGTNVLGTPTSPLRTDPTGTTTQPVSGNVGISGSLPAGTNDIGTVQVASPSPTAGSADCVVQVGDFSCSADTGVVTSGPVFNTVSVRCSVLKGQHVEVFMYIGADQVPVPLSYQVTIDTEDDYVGTVTNLDMPAFGGGLGSNVSQVYEDYTATPSNPGAACFVTFSTTSS